jgi:hypothetical protein
MFGSLMVLQNADRLLSSHGDIAPVMPTLVISKHHGNALRLSHSPLKPLY